ncbi:cyclin-domain-containing protein [Aspergillus pseudonomiae]|uniref:Cyclin-domain-containing protein n=1 Tax=Aspergillus pseudonomiae TaxID=1506151 RepID=A0A5N7CXR2_9EURO|nr:cyclin-domain-containing protein [Aspergillus pseudonomiae]KAB8255901.1 cyclin-domain-containing protein [Aspergillus pseudonomiae]KAE8398348.1 cyclin-domain-containing protein [Aspergillus pseudonomiae]
MTGYSSEDEGPHDPQSDVVSRWAQSDLEPAREDKEGALKSDFIDQMPPVSALRLLCVYIELLVKQTIDELDDCRVDASSLAKDRAPGDSVSSGEATPVGGTEIHCYPAGYNDAGRDLIQLGILSKRFLSKRVPSITLKDYLLRLHRYCPMSTAVYLATSMYLTRMVTVERTISLNHRNMHRLVLAGLRVAMKTLEDLSYPHSRIAKVGGVTERELSKLEISFCFLVDFELRVDLYMLTNQARALVENAGYHSDVAS